MNDLMPKRFQGLRLPEFPFFEAEFMKPFFGGLDSARAAFRVDVRDEGENYVLEAELPGLCRDDIKVDVEEGMLTISAQWTDDAQSERRDYVINERRSGRVQRAFALDNVLEDEISAEYANGMLMIKLPKRERMERSARRVELS